MSRPESEIVDHLVNKYRLDAPVLDRDHAAVLDDDEEILHDLSGSQYGFYGESVRVPFRRITVAVPFSGDGNLFLLRPGTYTFNPPRAAIVGNELHVAYESPVAEPASAEQVRQAIDHEITSIQNYLVSTTAGIDAHNRQISDLAQSQITTRRAKLAASRELRGSLGFPLRRRGDAGTYSVPVTRRRLVTLSPPPVSGGRPVPYLSDADYEEVLKSLIHQRNALERSPQLVADMNEERVRDVLLVGLNAAFEGRAAGEVFNGAGKTDLLVREGDKNVFIGECKYWRGPKTITSTLDQLLSYLTWRDTKAALLLFIRGQDKADVIDKALLKFKEHPSFRAATGGDIAGERYNFRFSAVGDSQQTIRLAFLPFLLT